MSGHSATMKSRSSGNPADMSDRSVCTRVPPPGRAVPIDRSTERRAACRPRQPGDGDTHDMALEPFHVHIDDARLELLDARLRSTVWADELGDGLADPWRDGVSGPDLPGLVAYWRETYDWRAQEAAMNRWPQVRGEIADDGGAVTVHAIHER